MFIEQQAIAALTHLASLIMLLIDPTETCGYTKEEQHNLLTQIKKMFSTTPIIIVENKADIHKTTTKHIKISCTTKEGIAQLKEILLTTLDL